jgi:uncharacterized membrane protein (DUF373 family)
MAMVFAGPHTATRERNTMAEDEAGPDGVERAEDTGTSGTVPPGLIRVLQKVIAAVVFVLLIASLVALVFLTFLVAVEVWNAILDGDGAELGKVLTAVLTVFIFIEVLRVSVQFLRHDELNILDLIDVTLAVIFREVWVGLFSEKLDWQEILALGVLVAAIGLVRYFAARPEATLNED